MASTTTEITEDEHPVNLWIRLLPDSVVSALIRENPLWLRSAAVADRICRWRLECLDPGKGKADALGYLRRLASPHASTRKGRPAIGPRSSAADIQRAVADVEAQHGAAREIWHSVRDEAGDKATLLHVGETFIRRLGWWDSPAMVEWAKQRGDSPFLLRLTEDQVVKHLGRHGVIVTEARGLASRHGGS